MFEPPPNFDDIALLLSLDQIQVKVPDGSPVAAQGILQFLTAVVTDMQRAETEKALNRYMIGQDEKLPEVKSDEA